MPATEPTNPPGGSLSAPTKAYGCQLRPSPIGARRLRRAARSSGVPWFRLLAAARAAPDRFQIEIKAESSSAPETCHVSSKSARQPHRSSDARRSSMNRPPVFRSDARALVPDRSPSRTNAKSGSDHPRTLDRLCASRSVGRPEALLLDRLEAVAPLLCGEVATQVQHRCARGAAKASAFLPAGVRRNRALPLAAADRQRLHVQLRIGKTLVKITDEDLDRPMDAKWRMASPESLNGTTCSFDVEVA